jgi:hypothetical protein
MLYFSDNDPTSEVSRVASAFSSSEKRVSMLDLELFIHACSFDGSGLICSSFWFSVAIDDVITP